VCVCVCLCLFVCFLRAVISAFGLTVLLNTFMFYRYFMSLSLPVFSNKWLIDWLIVKLVYFVINQVACTSWKRVLSQANGAPTNLDVHSEPVYRYLDLFSRLPPVAKQRVLGNYFKFMFVRHPFERLVSAHHDKLVDGEYVRYCMLL